MSVALHNLEHLGSTVLPDSFITPRCDNHVGIGRRLQHHFQIPFPHLWFIEALLSQFFGISCAQGREIRNVHPTESPEPSEPDASSNGWIVLIVVCDGWIQHKEHDSIRGRPDLTGQTISVLSILRDHSAGLL